MTTSDAGPPEGEADGRRLRAERSRDAVVDAMLALYGEGVDRPSPELIAERAGVSRRSVFRHFDDLETLRAAAVERHLERMGPAFDLDPAGPGLDLDGRVAHLVAHRSALYERMTPVRVVSERQRGRSAVVTRNLDRLRRHLRGQLEVLFAAELDAPDRERVRATVLDAVEVASSWATWNVLRSQQGCDPEAASHVVARLVRGALEAG